MFSSKRMTPVEASARAAGICVEMRTTDARTVLPLVREATGYTDSGARRLLTTISPTVQQVLAMPAPVTDGPKG